MCSAIGDFGPLVLIVSIKDMPADAMLAKHVQFMTNTNEVGSSGWLYFCRTKAGNAKLWTHWFKEVVIPTLIKNHVIYQVKASQYIISIKNLIA
jgi:hypothetical protein